MAHPVPPRFFITLFRWFCHPAIVRSIEGDLIELYNERLPATGKRKADLLFALDVILLFRPGIVRPLTRTQPLIRNGMFRNYLKVGIRNLVRYKTFSFINIFGLAVAMSVCLLVILMLTDQYRYDQFHQKKERIFRVLSERPYSTTPFASTPPALAPKLRSDYAVVEKATHVVTGVGGDAASDRTIAEMRGFFADEFFLDVFDFPLESGNASNALKEPYAMVITESMADILFRDSDALGKTVGFTDRGLHYLKSGKDSEPVPWGVFTITGILKDGFRSHLKFDVLVSAATQGSLAASGKYSPHPDGWDKAYTYVLARDGSTLRDLRHALHDLTAREYSGSVDLKEFSLHPQPLTDITPGIMVNQPPSFQLPIAAYYLLGAIAAAIMLSACLNYITLTTARALTRAKEIGVRKVTGAFRKDLILQFLGESVILSFLALSLALLMLMLIRPAFTSLWLNQYLGFELTVDPWIYAVFALFALVTGIVAGLYPAVRLSSFAPAKVVKGVSGYRGRKLGVRRILNVGQFVISLFFVVTSILIYTQFRHFMDFEYGFNPKSVINIELQGNRFETVAASLNSVAGVATVSASEYVPATGRTSGMDILKPGTEEAINFRVIAVDEHFTETFELDIIAGIGLPPTVDSVSRSIVLNETAVRALGFGSAGDAVGETVIQGWNKEPLQVVGVVRDFWLKLPVGGERLEPAFLRHQRHNFSYANVKLSSADIPGTIAEIGRRWKSIDAMHPFKYRFHDEELASTHAGIFDVVTIVAFLAFIAITIACLGLLGMATYTAETKKKEVSIRKVLGAGSASLAFLLSKEFLKILAIAIFIGVPLSWFVNNLWLQNFPQRAEFGFGTLALGTGILLLLGIVTISSQIVRATKGNPADALKTE